MNEPFDGLLPVVWYIHGITEAFGRRICNSAVIVFA
jgi:hypothetical protein